MVGPGVGDRHLAAGHPDRRQVGRGHHPVGHDRVARGSQLVDPLDLDARGPRPAHHRPHVAQHGGQVGHLGLLGRVLDDGRALGQDGRHRAGCPSPCDWGTRGRPGSPPAGRPGTVPRTSPWEDSKRAPMALSPLTWKSMGRSPKSSPPGSGIRTVAAASQEQARGPPPTPACARTARRARRAPGRRPAGVVTATSPLSRRSTAAPMARSTLAMVSTSSMRGTLDSTVQPSASRQRHHQLESRILRSACPDGALERPVGLDDDLVHDPKYRRWRASRRAARRSETNYGQRPW